MYVCVVHRLRVRNRHRHRDTDTDIDTNADRRVYAMRACSVCGRRLFIKRRRVREAATADCQQMAAITYPVAVARLQRAAKCPGYGTDNRHLNCRGAEAKEQQTGMERLVARRQEEAKNCDTGNLFFVCALLGT